MQPLQFCPSRLHHSLEPGEFPGMWAWFVESILGVDNSGVETLRANSSDWFEGSETFFPNNPFSFISFHLFPLFSLHYCSINNLLSSSESSLSQLATLFPGKQSMF